MADHIFSESFHDVIPGNDDPSTDEITIDPNLEFNSSSLETELSLDLVGQFPPGLLGFIFLVTKSTTHFENLLMHNLDRESLLRLMSVCSEVHNSIAPYTGLLSVSLDIRYMYKPTTLYTEYFKRDKGSKKGKFIRAPILRKEQRPSRIIFDGSFGVSPPSGGNIVHSALKRIFEYLASEINHIRRLELIGCKWLRVQMLPSIIKDANCLQSICIRQCPLFQLRTQDMIEYQGITMDVAFSDMWDATTFEVVNNNDIRTKFFTPEMMIQFDLARMHPNLVEPSHIFFQGFINDVQPVEDPKHPVRLLFQRTLQAWFKMKNTFNKYIASEEIKPKSLYDKRYEYCFPLCEKFFDKDGIEIRDELNKTPFDKRLVAANQSFGDILMLLFICLFLLRSCGSKATVEEVIRVAVDEARRVEATLWCTRCDDERQVLAISTDLEELNADANACGFSRFNYELASEWAFDLDFDFTAHILMKVINSAIRRPQQGEGTAEEVHVHALQELANALAWKNSQAPVSASTGTERFKQQESSENWVGSDDALTLVPTREALSIYLQQQIVSWSPAPDLKDLFPYDPAQAASRDCVKMETDRRDKAKRNEELISARKN